MPSLGPILAVALAHCGLVLSQLFNLTVYLPGSPLNGQAVQADGEAFYLGLSVLSSYCPSPSVPVQDCPNATEGTVFAGMSALWVEVPGGQQIYTTPEGELGFTIAHSESVPVGAYIGYWYNITLVSDCAPPVELLTFKAPNATEGGVLACPDVSTYLNSTATYQIYALTPAFNQTNCITLDGLLPTYQPTNAFGAWEYI